MNRHAGGLIDYNQVFILIYDGKVQMNRRNIPGTGCLLDKNLEMIPCGKRLLHIIVDAVYEDAFGHPFDLGQILGGIAEASEVLFYSQPIACGIDNVVNDTIHLHFSSVFGNIYYSIFCGRRKEMTGLSTLCYIMQNDRYLMLHRTIKEKDVNKDKWIGVGGHFEEGESPEECLLREVREETGYTLTSYRYRGIVTFISGNGVTEYMSLFTADGFEGEPIPCDEGELAWVPVKEVYQLNIWEGDKIFFRLLEEREEFFSLKLVYDGHDRLISASLDGKTMENDG